jgi:predicted O-methyltransferase YrrM
MEAPKLVAPAAAGWPHTDPGVLYRYRDAVYAPDLLLAAVGWLDFFSWLARHPFNSEQICRSMDLKARPVDVMLTLFTALGLVQYTGGVYRVTEMAREHLVEGSPWHLASYYAALRERPTCREMLSVLRSGQPAKWSGHVEDKDWESAMEDEAFARGFTAAMDARGAYLGTALARQVDCRAYHHLLDIAGGSGLYACAIAAAHPHLRGTVLEKPPVDQVARRLIGARGFAERVGVVGADMWTDAWPTGCDLHLLSNVLHDWDVPAVRRLLARSFVALAAGGMVVIHDAHLNAAKSGPLAVAEYSVLVMYFTQGRCYSVAELSRMLEEAGFTEVAFCNTVADRSIITARKPR